MPLKDRLLPRVWCPKCRAKLPALMMKVEIRVSVTFWYLQMDSGALLTVVGQGKSPSSQ